MRIAWRPRRFEVVVVAGIIIELWLMLILTFARALNISRGTSCQTNLKQAGLAMMQYIRNYDEKYPPANRWTEVLSPYTKDHTIFHCPSAQQNGYSLNSDFDRLSWSQLDSPALAPMIFESAILQKSQHDAGKSWLSEPRHPQGVGVVFADGHFEWQQQPPQFRSLRGAIKNRGLRNNLHESPLK